MWRREPSDKPAQSQPPEAVNQQDEVVTIQLAPGQGTDDVLQILRSGDKFETNGYVTQAFELHQTAALEMKYFIQQAVEQEKGVVRGVATKPADGSAPRYFLVVTTTREQMPGIGETIRALDVPGLVNRQGSVRRAIRVKYRRASDLGAILKSTRLSKVSKVFADDPTNTLYYDDSEYVANAAEDYVRFFDVPIPQIEFDVRIVEVREDDAGKVGLDWDAWKRTVGGQFDVTGNYFEGGDQFVRLDTLMTIDAAALASFLNYTVQTGNAELVQRSRINASNLKPAVISDRKRVPYVDYVRSERSPDLLTETNRRVDAYEEADADDPDLNNYRVVSIVPSVTNRLEDLGSDEEGIYIAIQPVIGTESVTADIDISVNSVTGYDSLGRPMVTEQDLTNQFTLQDGRQILLGTLERETSVETRSGIPGLRDIAVLKYLFSVKTTRAESSRLFILATPTFSATGYDAKTIDEQKTTPTLRIVERDVVLDDGGTKLPPGL